jgi:cytidylate kinase
MLLSFNSRYVLTGALSARSWLPQVRLTVKGLQRPIRKGFENTYDVDITAKENFDLTIDTSNISPSEAVELILASYHRWVSQVPVA